MRASCIPSAADPYLFQDYTGVGGAASNADLTGHSLATPRLTAGETTAVIIVAGQSNAANAMGGFYTAANPTKIDNLSIVDGATYRATEPLLGCSGSIKGNCWYAVADKLIAGSLFQRVILVPIACSGTSISQWQSGGALNPRLIAASRRCTAVGLTPTMYCWMQGEQDQINGTSQATYAAALSQVIATPRGIGYNQPWFIGKCTYANGVTSAAVRAAQAGVVNGTDIFAGADTDTLTGTAVNRQVDDIHLTAAGAIAAANLWKTAIDAVF